MRIVFQKSARTRLRDLIQSLSARNQARIDYIEVSKVEFREIIEDHYATIEDPLDRDHISLIGPDSLRFRGIRVRGERSTCAEAAKG